jgi:hypothetical protein
MSAFWPDDTVTGNHVNSLPNPFDHYLTPLVDTDLDPANFPLSPPRRSSRTTTNDFNAAASRPLQTHNMPLPGPSRSETQLTGISLDDSLDTQFTDDLFGDEALPHSSQTSFSETVPPTRKRNAPLREPSPVTKRPRTSGSGIEEPTVSQPDSFAQQNAFIQDLDEEDLFGESPRDLNNTEDDPSAEDLHTIDLTEANEVPESLKKPEEDKRIKISTFQCVICMDDVTTLTVTHCGMPDLHMIFHFNTLLTHIHNLGHLYCAQCLHSSLHVEATKGKCPMCRSKIDMKPRNTYTAKTKGYWPLELKLMTTTRKGKRKANPTT